MTTLIPALDACAARMNAGERRLAERVKQKIECDYFPWWDAPIGPKQTRPGFVLNPRRLGALILEMRAWVPEHFRTHAREHFEIAPEAQSMC